MRWYAATIRWLFQRLYREFAWTYDAVAWAVSAGLWRRWALSALPELAGRVLELGFGTGHVQLALAARPAVCGLDASPHMAARAAARLRRHGHTPRLVNGLAQQLPFATAAFDSLLATFPTEYMLDPATHAELRRVLAPGGRLVIVPLAQLDPGFYTGIVDLAYRLTLQAPVRRSEASPSAEVPLQIAGIALVPRWVAIGPSRVLILTGTRDVADL
jgi:ubiquinone/menaquinone biosynthesis C-methylase UbiE